MTWPKGVDIETLPDARKWAAKVIADAKAGIDPRTEIVDAAERTKRAAAKAEASRFEKVVERYVDRRIRKEKNNRSADVIERTFEIYATPRWKDRNIHEIRRTDVNALLDDVTMRRSKAPMARCMAAL